MPARTQTPNTPDLHQWKIQRGLVWAIFGGVVTSLLTGCSAAQESNASVRSVVSPAPAVESPSGTDQDDEYSPRPEEQQFLDAVLQIQPSLASRDEFDVLVYGAVLCNQTEENSPASVVEQISEDPGPYSTEEATAIYGTAVTTLCPEHEEAVNSLSGGGSTYSDSSTQESSDTQAYADDLHYSPSARNDFTSSVRSQSPGIEGGNNELLIIGDAFCQMMDNDSDHMEILKFITDASTGDYSQDELSTMWGLSASALCPDNLHYFE